MDLNHRSPGYEPDGISRLPHLVMSVAKPYRFSMHRCSANYQSWRNLEKYCFLSPFFHCIDEDEVHESTVQGHRVIVILLCSTLLLGSLSGCIGTDEVEGKSSEIDLVVYYDATSGVIEEVIQSGQQVSETGVELTFDFSYTTSSAGEIVTFYYIPGDGSSAAESNADETGLVSYTYLTHGLFDAAVGAIDDQGNEYFENLTIRIDKKITWAQENTANPNTMTIETTPDCNCDPPEKITIDSTVSNPENPTNPFAQGQTVSVTWRLLNSTDATTAESTPEQVADGQDATWMHNQYFVEPGTWKLEVDVEAEGNGDEQVTVDHIVGINYVAQESIPNPMSVPTPEE